MSLIDVYCFPFAGGNKYSYRDLQTAGRGILNLVVLEPPGRGARVGEALLTDLSEIVDDSYEQLIRWADLKKPYAIYGHSMGATVGFLITKKLVQAGLPPPTNLFFTGRAGPSVIRMDKHSYTLTDAEFLNRIISLGGLPDELLQHNDLLDFFMPILKADFHALDRYVYASHQPLLEIPIDVVIGTQESVTVDQALAWSQESTGAVNISQLPGNHFFIYQHTASLLKLMTSKLSMVT